MVISLDAATSGISERIESAITAAESDYDSVELVNQTLRRSTETRAGVFLGPLASSVAWQETRASYSGVNLRDHLAYLARPALQAGTSVSLTLWVWGVFKRRRRHDQHQSPISISLRAASVSGRHQSPVGTRAADDLVTLGHLSRTRSDSHVSTRLVSATVIERAWAGLGAVRRRIARREPRGDGPRSLGGVQITVDAATAS